MKILFSTALILFFVISGITNARGEESTITATPLGPDHLYNPVGLALDGAGNIYVADYGGHSVLKFDKNGRFLSKFGTYGSQPGQLKDPTGIAVDSLGNIYVVDQGNSRIEKFDPSDNFLSQFGSPGGSQGQLDLSIGIVVDSSGNVYVGDLDNSRILKFDPSGGYLLQFPTHASVSALQYLPGYLAIDGSSNIYALDIANHFIQKFDASGNLLMQFKVSNGTKTFYSAYGVAVDNQGNIYASTSGQIVKFDKSGNFVGTIGTQGRGAGHMDQSQGIAIDGAGNIYVADAGNKRIDKFDASGNFVTYFGSSNQTATISSKILPIVISQVEMYGPLTNHTVCGTTEYQLSKPMSLPVSQWIELYNPTDSPVQMEGYDFGITHKSENKINLETQSDDPGIMLGPHQRCVYAITNPDGPVIDDPRNVIISLAYRYNDTQYTISTPPLTDTYNDTRTWQLTYGNWIFAAPSPYSQLQSGVKADEVVCNKGLVLMARPENMVACINSFDEQRAKSHGWSEITRPTYTPVIDQTYYSGPGYSCRFIFPHLSITNSSGFSVYNDSIVHYKILPGQNGTITYTITGPSYGLDPPIYSPNQINITNGAYLYYDSGTARTGSETNSLFGVTISYQPTSEIISYNGSAAITATVSASPDVKQGKYGISFIPGGCAGSPFVELDVGMP
ncbi:MAG: SBBP repeat-containing protein [Thaumarchaeota archaeon]|nr:SBBP repeat-containing protein [Nitrososphaerota archaeon]